MCKIGVIFRLFQGCNRGEAQTEWTQYSKVTATDSCATNAWNLLSGGTKAPIRIFPFVHSLNMETGVRHLRHTDSPLGKGTCSNDQPVIQGAELGASPATLRKPSNISTLTKCQLASDCDLLQPSCLLRCLRVDDTFLRGSGFGKAGLTSQDIDR